MGALALLLVLTIWSCKKYPTDPEHPLPVVAAGGYEGVAALSAPLSNIRIVVIREDSTHLNGTWSYRGSTGNLENVYANSAEDTMWFGFRYAGTLYRTKSELQDIGMVVHVQEPSGIADFRVNREFGGYNLTGYWNGQLASAQWGALHDATFSMDQRGALFAGLINTSFVETYQFQLTTGSVNSATFQLQGVVLIGGTSYPTLCSGTYSGADTISGIWEAGDHGTTDNGQFLFVRSYQ
jgi:hypothetical protein